MKYRLESLANIVYGSILKNSCLGYNLFKGTGRYNYEYHHLKWGGGSWEKQNRGQPDGFKQQECASHCILLHKVWCLIGISDTDKTDNLTCEIIYNFTCENYCFSKIIIYCLWIFHIARKTVVHNSYNKQNNTCVLGNITFNPRK